MPPKPDPSELSVLLKYMQTQDEQRREDEARRRRAEAQREEQRAAEFNALLEALNNASRREATPVPSSEPAPVQTQERKRIPVKVPDIKLKCESTFSRYKVWKREWQDFVKISGLETLPHDEQLAYLRQVLSEDMKDHLKHNLKIADDSNSAINKF